LAQNIGIESSLEAEFGACMFAMEKADDLDLRYIWIDCESFQQARRCSLENEYRMA